MQLKKSIVTGQSDAAIKTEPISAHSIYEITGPQCNNLMVQNVLLIWLDQNMDNSNLDCRNTIAQLRHVVNTINIFTDSEECIQFLERMDYDKACMIISGSLGQYIVPRIHNMSQVDSIFIFCSDKEYHEQWVSEWSKVKGLFTEISSICDALKQATQQCEQNAVSISIMASDGGSKKNLNQLDPPFMYIQIIKEILLQIKFEEEHIKTFLDYCRSIFAENDHELNNIERLETNYYNETPIWWYTLECFLYPMLNRALRLMDIDIIIKMGFFIVDLYRHIEQLHSEQFDDSDCDNSFTVYRGQGMSKEEFEKLMQTKGGLLSFNCFLSTSKKHNVSFRFAHRATTNPDLVGILFAITVYPCQSTTPFACISNVSYFKGENEVLFAMQTVFRIGDITPLDGNSRLFQVELTLTADDDKDLRQLTDYIRGECYPKAEGWYRLGSVLYKMGQFQKAEEVYQLLLKQVTNTAQEGPTYNQLGLVSYKQKKYEEAITFYEKAIEIYKKDPSNTLRLANGYNNIGMVYDEMHDYRTALDYYKKSLEIKHQILPANHLDLGGSYNNIGLVYRKIGEYSKALSFYEKALAIKEQALPPNHPSFASTFGNIGLLYEDINDYKKAYSFFERSIEIVQHSLPPTHPSLKQYQNDLKRIKMKL